MWQIQYMRAREIHAARHREADQVRVIRRIESASAVGARETRPGRRARRNKSAAVLRRRTALVAVWVAHRIDPTVSRHAARRLPRRPGSLYGPGTRTSDSGA
jgi:hypothetical protein